MNDNVPLEHGGLPCVLPYAVHLDLGYLPDTQGSLGLLSEPCTPTQTFKKFWGGVVGWWWWVAHKILVTAQVLGFGIWIGLWPRACQKYQNS